MKNLVGETFGKLFVISFDDNRNGVPYWNCLCSCGVEKSISGRSLTRGKTKSCGCSAHARKYKVGDKFGNLTIIHMPEGDLHTEKVLCKCDCGKEVECFLNNLARGTSTSCGCLRSYYAKQSRSCRGESRSRLYREWSSAKTRCYNKNTHYYKNYGGRGIKMCDEWQTYWPFREWALSHGYHEDLTLERIDVDGDYCPENCTWIPMEVQTNNKQNSHYITFNGQKKTIAQWSRETGLSTSCIQYRLKAGKTPEECLSLTKWGKTI